MHNDIKGRLLFFYRCVLIVSRMKLVLHPVGKRLAVLLSNWEVPYSNLDRDPYILKHFKRFPYSLQQNVA